MGIAIAISVRTHCLQDVYESGGAQYNHSKTGKIQGLAGVVAIPLPCHDLQELPDLRRQSGIKNRYRWHN
ncbi:MAG: hypothetical protein WBB29_05545 [Geitlerinemataceae cyanobacterium]